MNRSCFLGTRGLLRNILSRVYGGMNRVWNWRYRGSYDKISFRQHQHRTEARSHKMIAIQMSWPLYGQSLSSPRSTYDLSVVGIQSLEQPSRIQFDAGLNVE